MNFATKTTPKLPQLTAWSYSRYSDWAGCPLACKLKHIDRIKEPPNAAMERGIAIHTMAEGYVKGTLAKLPPELALFKDEFAMLRKLYKSKKTPMMVEDNWAFTKDWDESRWDDWTHCWVRIKLDCAHYITPVELVVTDWKTGKFSEYKAAEYMTQLSLYALSAMLLHPHLERVQVRLGFTDQGLMYPPAPLVYTREDLPKLKKEWNARVKPMMADTKFPPKPNHGCQWCYYGQSGKAKGGPGICKF